MTATATFVPFRRLLAAWLVFALFVPMLALGKSEQLVSVIVQAANALTAKRAVENAGGAVTFELPIVNGVAADVPQSSIPLIEGGTGVRAVTPNMPMVVQGTVVPSPLHNATAVYPTVIGADKVWKQKFEGSGVSVALIDTGIAKVADLSGRVIGGIDLTNEGNPYNDSFGHGTFVAGLIAGNGTSSGGAYKGVAPKTNLVSVKIAGESGASDVSHVLAALQWVVSFKSTYNIRVVNLSLGTDSTQSYRYSPLNYAVERAWASGIVVVVSASNRGPNPNTVSKPGDDPYVITVGSIDDRATATRVDDVMSGFSGAGPTAADGLAKPDLVASGRSVVSLRSPGSSVDTAYPLSRIGDSYFRGTGTSFSTGITSGAAALILNKEPALTPDQVKHRMISTAAPGPAMNKNVDGYGSLDAYAAANAGTFTSANQGLTRGFGTGDMGKDRGTLKVSILVPKESCGGLLGCLLKGTLDLLTGLIRIVLSGLKTAQYKDFNNSEYRSSTWSGSHWYQSQWSGSHWYQTEWEGSHWYGSHWYATDWYGSHWYAIAWE